MFTISIIENVSTCAAATIFLSKCCTSDLNLVNMVNLSVHANIFSKIKNYNQNCNDIGWEIVLEVSAKQKNAYSLHYTVAHFLYGYWQGCSWSLWQKNLWSQSNSPTQNCLHLKLKWQFEPLWAADTFRSIQIQNRAHNKLPVCKVA